MRASAIALLVLLPVHLVSFHLLAGSLPFTESQLHARWATPWRLIDWLTLTLALVHGAIAMQPPLSTAPAGVIDGDQGSVVDGRTETAEDPGPGSIPFLRRMIGTAALVVAAVAIGSLTYVVFTYRLVG